MAALPAVGRPQNRARPAFGFTPGLMARIADLPTPTSRLGSPRLSTAGVEFVTVLAKGLKLSGLAPVEAVEGILFKS